MLAGSRNCSVGSGRSGIFYNAVYLASQISLLCAVFFLLKIKALIFRTQILNKFYLCYALKEARKFLVEMKALIFVHISVQCVKN